MVRTSAKARLTESPAKFNHLLTGPLPTLSSLKILRKSVCKFLHKVAKRQTDKQRQKQPSWRRYWRCFFVFLSGDILTSFVNCQTLNLYTCTERWPNNDCRIRFYIYKSRNISEIIAKVTLFTKIAINCVCFASHAIYHKASYCVKLDGSNKQYAAVILTYRT